MNLLFLFLFPWADINTPLRIWPIGVFGWSENSILHICVDRFFLEFFLAIYGLSAEIYKSALVMGANILQFENQC